MSDEHIDRSLQKASTSSEPQLRAAVEASILSAQRAISAYWAVEQKIPLFISDNQMAPVLPEHLFAEAKLLPERSVIFDRIAKGGIGIEIGTQTGAFAKIMLERAAPERLYLVDISFEQFDHSFFAPHVQNKMVTLIEGFSWDVVSSFDDESFDWIYLDASHAYEHVVRDIEVAKSKLKIGGYFIFNDFTNWSPFEMTPYGVMQAVTDFLGQCDGTYKIMFMALHRLGYHDIALKRIA
jgi:hypothetical protein